MKDPACPGLLFYLKYQLFKLLITIKRQIRLRNRNSSNTSSIQRKRTTSPGNQALLLQSDILMKTIDYRNYSLFKINIRDFNNTKCQSLSRKTLYI